ESHAAFVGKRPGRLEHDQAVLRRHAAKPPAELVVSKRFVVSRRVIASQAEPEPALAVEVAMARPLIASGLGEQRSYVGAKTGCAFRGRPGYPQRNLLGLIAEADSQRGLSVGNRPDNGPGRDFTDRAWLDHETASGCDVAQRSIGLVKRYRKLLARCSAVQDHGCWFHREANPTRISPHTRDGE